MPPHKLKNLEPVTKLGLDPEPQEDKIVSIAFFAFLPSSASGSSSNFVKCSRVFGLWGGEGLTFSMVTPIPLLLWP